MQSALSYGMELKKMGPESFEENVDITERTEAVAVLLIRGWRRAHECPREEAGHHVPNQKSTSLLNIWLIFKKTQKISVPDPKLFITDPDLHIENSGISEPDPSFNF